MSAEIIQFIPRTAPKQSTDLIELRHRLIREISYDSEKIWSGEHTAADYYLAPPDDCA